MIKIIKKEPWKDPRGGEIQRVTVDNGILAIEVLSLGGIIRSLWAPDRHGERQNIVLGCDSAQAYLDQDAHLGAIAGRFANRIKGGKLSRQGQCYQLDVNNQDNCLHGGSIGFNQKQWQLETLEDGVRLTLISPDGDMGFPGNCKVQLDYRLNGNSLMVDIIAMTDKPCPVNLTQHSYFNLDGSDSVAQHLMQNDCTKYLQTDEQGIPSTIEPVTPALNFGKDSLLAERLIDASLESTQGLDHCYLMEKTSETLVRFGRISSPKSGRMMTLYTNQPGVQVYTANFLQGTIGAQGQVFKQYQGICLEPQLCPDAPNQPELLGQSWLEVGEQYHHLSQYEFETMEE
ncbi:galactose mutarotase [Parashewanella curva]|uniref:Aldose 1-epimerase n=1 Tax=Parashewanella curva TaxID=2338552 RepID=A0A3L8Q0M9_9GAMM|nr:aldose epimerase family protein [Parashewanella curva]RLV60599.1 galactose mutarotase [Parashewanella curva]